jgi:hypothetical protein
VITGSKTKEESKMGKKQGKWVGDPPPSGVELVWELGPGESFKAPMSERKQIYKAIEDRHNATGKKLTISYPSEDEIEVSFKPMESVRDPGGQSECSNTKKCAE